MSSSLRRRIRHLPYSRRGDSVLPMPIELSPIGEVESPLSDPAQAPKKANRRW